MQQTIIKLILFQSEYFPDENLFNSSKCLPENNEGEKKDKSCRCCSVTQTHRYTQIHTNTRTLSDVRLSLSSKLKLMATETL